MDYVKLIYLPLAARAARLVLIGRNRVRRSPERGRFTRADLDGLLKTAWGNYAERAGQLPKEATVGRRMNVRSACFRSPQLVTAKASEVVFLGIRRAKRCRPRSFVKQIGRT